MTEIAVANAFNEKLETILIGKSASPLCFKNIKSLHCRYRSQKMSWVTGELFEEWVKGVVDHRFRVKNMKITLLVDNCPAALLLKV